MKDKDLNAIVAYKMLEVVKALLNEHGEVPLNSGLPLVGRLPT